MNPILDARGVHKTFGTLAALGGANLQVAPGEFHGLIGPNGSGKSTLLKCLAGAEVPTAGTIRIGNRDITTAGPAERSRQGLSLKFQITAVLPLLTCYDNIQLALLGHRKLRSLLFSRRIAREQVMDLLQKVGLADRALEPAASLSHGQQQWLEMAMALASAPKVLLLDEPTGGMSVEERRATGALLAPLRGHCAIVIVEHDLDFIRGLCDRITVMDQGQAIACGSVAEVQANDRVRSIYVRRV